jgi:hypothetical protein
MNKSLLAVLNDAERLLVGQPGGLNWRPGGHRSTRR